MRGMLALLLAVLLLSGCAAKLSAPAPAADTVTFTDDLGRTVTVEKQPQRVASLLGSFTQVWMLAGGTVCATADDAWEDFELDLAEDTVNLGTTQSLSMELLLSAEPDFILASTNRRQNMEWLDTLESTGIPVAYFDVADFADYLRLLDICTDLTGQKDRYETYGLAVQEQIDAVLEKSRERLASSAAPTVLSMRASAAGLTVKNSEGNVLGEMLQALGCVNIADSDATLLEDLSVEQILLADPDYIFIVQRGDDTEGMQRYLAQFISDHPAWAELTAVREGRVYMMDKRLYNLKPNDRWGEAYEKLEEILQNG
ncbi:MAG: ABC transporter substrate-binding protein [Oscillospiraceae bacterium]|nr:ABC transporter substrate-binding protein [Oscillospiraceae bacterium]